ncbi:phosphotransferase family protein [Actinomadura rugatobispora]|uniref:Phosphotransferase family protein n=1 Tax=Actinomadura rugatobispora TaxID=1994 RepID=A0ABW0ZW37_9ACTN|nr:phosphotransferase family protein [Actinomadura rugatobispora]
MSEPAVSLTDQAPPALTAWLVGRLAAAEPPLVFTRIAGGYSMLTWRVEDQAGNTWVLRHRPPGVHQGRAHDTAREARAIGALVGTPVPVPRLRAVGTDDDPLGLSCHVTDFVPGHVLADARAAETCLPPQALAAASRNIVGALAALHAVAPDAVGLGDLGPREGYVQRQFRRWSGVVDGLALDDTGVVALFTRTGQRLRGLTPREQAGRVVHGDYRLGNAITGQDGTIRAVLDWELVTLGDPLADVGMMAAFWDPPAAAMLGTTMPTAAPGAISVDEALDHYARLSGRDLDAMAFYQAFACWRLAATGLRGWARYESGAMGQTHDTTKFLTAAATWLERADQLLARR